MKISVCILVIVVALCAGCAMGHAQLPSPKPGLVFIIYENPRGVRGDCVVCRGPISLSSRGQNAAFRTDLQTGELTLNKEALARIELPGYISRIVPVELEPYRAIYGVVCLFDDPLYGLQGVRTYTINIDGNPFSDRYRLRDGTGRTIFADDILVIRPPRPSQLSPSMFNIRIGY